MDIAPNTPTSDQSLVLVVEGITKDSTTPHEPRQDQSTRPDIVWKWIVGTMVHAVAADMRCSSPAELREKVNERYYAESGSRRDEGKEWYARNSARCILHLLHMQPESQLAQLVKASPRPALKMLLFASSVVVPSDEPDRMSNSRAAKDLAPLGLFQEYVAFAHVAGHHICEATTPKPGYGAAYAPEARLYMAQESLEAGRQLLTGLDENADLESTLRNYKFFEKDPVSASDEITVAEVSLMPSMSEMVDGDAYETELEQLVEKLYGHRYIHEGNTIGCPTARPDLISFEYKNDDSAARHVANAATFVLRTVARGYDIPELRAMKVPFGDDGEVIDGVEAMHRAAIAVKEGHVNMLVFDIKTITHVGNGVRDGELRGRRLYDVAKTTFAVMNFFRAIENAASVAQCKVTTQELLAHTTASVLEVDLDITSPRGIPGDQYPPLRHLGSPEDMGTKHITRIDLEPDVLQYMHFIWESDIDKHQRYKRTMHAIQKQTEVSAA